MDILFRLITCNVLCCVKMSMCYAMSKVAMSKNVFVLCNMKWRHSLYKEWQCVSISVCSLCRLNSTLFPLHDVPVHAVSSVELSAVSNTRRFQSSCVTCRFLYTRVPPLSLLHEDSVTYRFRYPRIQRALDIFVFCLYSVFFGIGNILPTHH